MDHDSVGFSSGGEMRSVRKLEVCCAGACVSAWKCLPEWNVLPASFTLENVWNLFCFWGQIAPNKPCTLGAAPLHQIAVLWQETEFRDMLSHPLTPEPVLESTYWYTLPQRFLVFFFRKRGMFSWNIRCLRTGWSCVESKTKVSPIDLTRTQELHRFCMCSVGPTAPSILKEDDIDDREIAPVMQCDRSMNIAK